MTYQIYIGDQNRPRKVLFDIEYYAVIEKGVWCSEVHVLPIVEGLWLFFESTKSENNFNHEEFLKDADEISELRGWLYEVNGNKPSLTTDLHYGERRDYIKHKVYAFASKYGLYVNED